MSETLAALLCKAMEENAVYDNHAVEPVCEALAASLVLDGVRVGDEGLRAALMRIEGWSRNPKGLTRPGVTRTIGLIHEEAARARVATPTPPEIDPTEPHIPRPSDICSVCGNGLVHIDAHRDPATPTEINVDCHCGLASGHPGPHNWTPPEIDVERLARALNASVGQTGWVRLTPPNAVEEWRENARIIAAAYKERHG